MPRELHISQVLGFYSDVRVPDKIDRDNGGESSALSP